MAGVLRLLRPFGVEVTGASGRDLVDRAATEECRTALGEHGVVIYRELHIDDDDLVAFTRLPGEPVVARTSEHSQREIDTITMDPEKTNAALAAFRKGEGRTRWSSCGAQLRRRSVEGQSRCVGAGTWRLGASLHQDASAGVDTGERS